MKKILLIFTGGTICAFPATSGGKNQSHAKAAGSYLEENFKKSASPYSGADIFDSRFLPQDILSENMTVNTWNHLLEIFRDETTEQTYCGIIVLHGTDTLAYTASLLSLALAGYKIPVCLVSAQLNLQDPRTNGYTNFRAAAELILNGIAPNVYAVYQNVKNGHEPAELLVHFGAHLLQCPCHSNNFHSVDEMPVPDMQNAKLSGRGFETQARLFTSLPKLSKDVLLLLPHTNLSYDTVNLENVGAIVHGTYHSESVCIGRAENPEETKNRSLSLSEVMEEDRPYSILSLLARCEKQNIPVFLSPCNAETCGYGTTENALAAGAFSIPATTIELAYAKAIIGRSLGKGGGALAEFMKKPVNYEFVY